MAESIRLRLECDLFGLVKTLAESGYTNYICGGALGFDTLAAIAIIKRKQEYNLNLLLAVPYKGQEKAWNEQDINLYNYILSHADNIVYLADKYYDGCLLARNRYMVDKSQLLVAYNTGIRGGTAFTCAYAMKQGVEMLNLV